MCVKFELCAVSGGGVSISRHFKEIHLGCIHLTPNILMKIENSESQTHIQMVGIIQRVLGGTMWKKMNKLLYEFWKEMQIWQLDYEFKI